MTDVSGKDGTEGPRNKGIGGRGLTFAIVLVAVIGALAVLYVIVSASLKPRSDASLTELARGEMAKMTVASPARPAPATTFTDANGRTLTLKDFEGLVVVVNLWATWCAPCKIEMPTLAKLQKTYAHKPVKVVAISIDRAEDAADARAFIARQGSLAFYHDPKFALAAALQPPVQGLPTTLIFDRQGREAARVAGDTDWSSTDARAVVDRVLTGG